MTPDPAAAGRTVVCPDCGRTNAADQALCECGYPLEFEQHPEPVQETPSRTRAPGERDDDDDTAELPAVVEPAPGRIPPQTGPAPTPVAAGAIPPWTGAAGPGTTRPGEVTCASCGEVNGPDRTWCARCGHRLRPEPTVAAPPPAAPAPRRTSAAPVVAAAILALVLTGVLGGLVWASRERPGEAAGAGTGTGTTTGTTTGSTTAASDTPSPVPQELGVDRMLGVAASSTQTADCVCAADLVKDGDVSTAWNHDGIDESDSTGVRAEGVTLTFSLAEPVHVVGLRVVNGYLKTSARGEDLFAANHRVREAQVTGRSGATTVTLDDVRDRQDVPADLGTTDTVTLTVLSTYPGSRYPDVALSEVRLLVVP